jgi:hypothetical protein
MKNMTAKSWLNVWQTDEYLKKKEYAFNIVDEYLIKMSYTPSTILDIGCGLAYETEFFQKKYNSEIFLLDDDFNNNTELQNRDVYFGSADTLKFYSNLEDLFISYKKRGLRYNFIYAKNPVIDPSIKFDLIYSNRSYGFHYPIETYLQLIKMHSHEQTVVVLDLWKKTFEDQIKKINLVNILEDGKEHFKVHIKI